MPSAMMRVALDWASMMAFSALEISFLVIMLSLFIG
jgi:hypothetical protein